MLLRLFLFFTFSLIKAFNLKGPALYQLTNPIDHATSPIWDQNRTILFFTDSYKGKIYSYNLNSGQNISVELNGTIFSIIPTKHPNIFIGGLNRSIMAIEWDGLSSEIGKKQILTTVGENAIDTVIHEGKADKNGRIWFGTKTDSPNGGTFYKLTRENVSLPQTILASLGSSNGLTWIDDKFFHIDSGSHQITQYDFDDYEGSIKNPKIVYDFMENDISFYPYGMTGDVDGNLWVALYGGGRVVKIDPTKGKLLDSISIPAQLVTSLTFGGEDFDILFVTTSRHDLSQKEREHQPSAGAIFAVTGLGTKGTPVYKSDIIGHISDSIYVNLRS